MLFKHIIPATPPASTGVITAPTPPMIAPDMIVAAPAALTIPATPAAGRTGTGHPHIFVPAIFVSGPGQALPAQAAAQQPDQHNDNEAHKHPSLGETFTKTKKTT
jgi:hypothetical protein